MILLFFLLSAALLQAAEPVEMPVAVWYDYPANQALPDLRFFKESGFNLCLFKGKERVKNLSLLQETEQIGITCILSEDALDRLIAGSDSGFRRIDSLTQLYSRYRSFRGFLLFEQPSLNDLAAIAEPADFFSGKYPQLECLTIARGLRLRDEAEQRTYRAYLIDLHRKLKLKQLIADNPGIIYGQLREEYFANLTALRWAAQQLERPFWAFVLLEPIGRPPITPLAYIRMQVYTGLAFGAQGVLYNAFPTVSALSQPAALIDPNAPLSTAISYCSIVNQEIAHWSKLLLRSKSLGVYGSSPMPDIELLPPLQPVKKVDALNMLIAFFRSPQNETLLMLVNTNFRYGTRCRVYFADNCSGMDEIAKDFTDPYRIRFRSAEDDRFAELIFKAGEGKLFRLHFE